jgi:hypothetical protein
MKFFNSGIKCGDIVIMKENILGGPFLPESLYVMSVHSQFVYACSFSSDIIEITSNRPLKIRKTDLTITGSLSTLEKIIYNIGLT